MTSATSYVALLTAFLLIAFLGSRCVSHRMKTGRCTAGWERWWWRRANRGSSVSWLASKCQPVLAGRLRTTLTTAFPRRWRNLDLLQRSTRLYLQCPLSFKYASAGMKTWSRLFTSACCRLLLRSSCVGNNIRRETFAGPISTSALCMMLFPETRECSTRYISTRGRETWRYQVCCEVGYSGVFYKR